MLIDAYSTPAPIARKEGGRERTMACINMFNPDPMGPRISFSNDLPVEQPPPLSRVPAGPAADTDFEFSVGSHPMMAADQLFSKGRILPLEDSGRHPHHGPQMIRPTTLRDELLAQAAADGGGGRPAKGSARWKGLLGLKKAHSPASKKDDDHQEVRSDGEM